MSEPFIGEVRPTAFSVVPRGWTLCNGQLLSIAQNQALFSILGTTYGGDGITTFALPNLQGRVPVGAGNTMALGEAAGAPSVTLLASQIPAHTHAALASSAAGAEDPTDRGPAAAKAYGPVTSLVALSPESVAPAGGSQAHGNMQPYLVINYMIALQGIFPSRS